MQALGQVLASNEPAWVELLWRRLPGLEVRWLAGVDSTSSELRRQLALGLALPRLLCTGEQTAGRGTLGRDWLQGQPGQDLALSLAMPMPDWAEREPRLSLYCGASIARALEDCMPSQVGLKWPNDLLLQSSTGWRKVGGLLLETVVAHRQTWLIVGLGLNINSTAEAFDAGIRATLCTLADVRGEPQDLAAVYRCCATALWTLLSQQRPDTLGLMADWANRDVTPGMRFTLHRGGEATDVVAVAVDPGSGALICEGSRGSSYIVHSHSELERLG
jgi:BirA family biotin operon repressor/biotin-[acetyl-CoA-carboxylase] ligase